LNVALIQIQRRIKRACFTGNSFSRASRLKDNGLSLALAFEVKGPKKL
jgi:hypothetical protein